jgi:hypothetical protein
VPVRTTLVLRLKTICADAVPAAKIAIAKMLM